MVNYADRALFDAVRNHHRRNSVWLMILRWVAVCRDCASINWRLGEAQDSRVDKGFRSRYIRHFRVLCSLVCRMNIFGAFKNILLLCYNFEVGND